jgi:tRNA pseudouridine13 synthase
VSEPTKDTLPYRSQTEGIGGQLRQEIEDFQVEEIEAYPASGSGEHVFARVEKREMTTPALVREVARRLEISPKDIGVAGLKDKRAVTRQTISLPPPVTPEAVLALEIPGARILSALRHGNKLKTGHLRGNHFQLTIRSLSCPPAEAERRASQVLQLLSRAPGAPNWYGEQRFGRAGDNAEVGKKLVFKTPIEGRRPKGRERRFFISAYQSDLFNRYLAMRMRTGRFDQVLQGDLLQKRESGGMFVCEDPAVDQERLMSGEVCITGPMFGHRMKSPPPGSPAADLESELLRDEGLRLEDFGHLGKLAMGTRRALGVILEGAAASALENALQVRFSLPSGSYATAIMRELCKGSTSNQ